MRTAVIAFGLVFALGAVGAINVAFPPSDPVIPQVLS